jgi:hypothetical protein
VYRDSQCKDLATSTLALSSDVWYLPGLAQNLIVRQEITVADCFSAPSQGYAESVGDVLQKRAGAYLGPSPKREGSQGGTNSLRTS